MFFRKGTFDSITASYHRFSFSIIETVPIFETLQLDLISQGSYVSEYSMLFNFMKQVVYMYMSLFIHQ